MIYLLDVNVLLALAYTTHVHYERVSCWLAEQRERQAPSTVKLATCATTELGFIRVASGPARLAASVVDARADLEMLASSRSTGSFPMPSSYQTLVGAEAHR